MEMRPASRRRRRGGLAPAADLLAAPAGRWGFPAAIFGLCLLISGCTPGIYHTFADRETRILLGSKAARVSNIEGDLSIETPAPADLEQLKRRMYDVEFFGKQNGAEKGARIVTLDDSLELAIRLNREYRDRKEQLYLQALDLTLIRHEFTPILHATSEVAVQSDTRTGAEILPVKAVKTPPPAATKAAADSTASSTGSDTSTGSATASSSATTTSTVSKPVTATKTATTDVAAVQKTINGIVVTNTQTRNSSLGFTMLQRTGARLAVDVTEDFLGFITGTRNVSNSALAVTLTQPILRGGGYKATMENLTQAEREMLYSLRDFSNYRREFIVGIVERYYNILQARAEVRNNWVSYQGFLKVVESEEALSNEGRRTLTQLGLLRQALLNAEAVWVRSALEYEAQVDQFKIELNLPFNERVVLDEGELDKLKIENVGLDRDEAVKVALTSRPDIVTTGDRIEDAERKIEVAKVNLLPGLDMNVTWDVVNPPGVNRPQLDFRRRRLSSGLAVDLPLDRKQERNEYQAALVTLDRTKREQSLAVDNVSLQIHNDWRALELAKRTFEIAVQGVKLAERRLEEQKLLFEINKGEARDLVEAQTDLVQSLNAQSSAMIAHTLARLRLWRDMGILFISKDGHWEKKLKEEGRE
ncbi:MAG: TolC family protein [Verrucomicrobiales bacterium]|nr:TolC family protein [Verrucomicrobiales bacterium]